MGLRWRARAFARALVEGAVYAGSQAGRLSGGLASCVNLALPCSVQVAMSFCSDREDAASMALTVVDRLLRGYGIDPRDVGR